ncbi:hypothetical protein ACIBCN_19765 [Nocardia sp. NPDC051052]|uniref:hypothetical protein n=1 Tax=Nocardia sp. NPDC051052 TaxID=3364322 RepID=UPI0037A6DB60
MKGAANRHKVIAALPSEGEFGFNPQLTRKKMLVSAVPIYIVPCRGRYMHGNSGTAAHA